jgi:hypothetical protein
MTQQGVARAASLKQILVYDNEVWASLRYLIACLLHALATVTCDWESARYLIKEGNATNTCTITQ